MINERAVSMWQASQPNHLFSPRVRLLWFWANPIHQYRVNTKRLTTVASAFFTFELTSVHFVHELSKPAIVHPAGGDFRAEGIFSE